MKRIVPFLMYALILIFIISCDKEKTEYVVPVFQANQSQFSDTDLLNAAYTNYLFPSNFYTENLGDTSLYYVNTVSIDSNSNDRRVYLSTQSLTQAYNWSIRSTYENSVFVDGPTSEKHFEFIRTENPNDQILIKFRTYKSDYITRDEFQEQIGPNHIGIFHKPDFNTADAKELIDYLYFIRNYKISGHKILSSYTVDSDEYIEVIHFELNIIYGDFDVNDMIRLIKNTYKIDKASGEILLINEVIAEVQGEEN